MLNCFDCGKEIIFDDNYISKYGKKIPITKSTKRPHRCKAKPFNKETRRRWWYQQQREAEQKREEQQKQEQRKQQYYQTYQESLKQENYYSILEVQKGCTEQELKEAWRKKMLEYHPDRNHSPDAEEKTKQIIEAYENIRLDISEDE
jgi:DnaJ domain